MGDHRFPFLLKMENIVRVKSTGLKVFSAFSGIGGAALGYRMAGFDVLGCTENDPARLALIRKNICMVFAGDAKPEDLPKKLNDVDVLDGMPPCPVPALAGALEQAEEVDRFAEFMEFVARLRPKAAAVSGVHGLMLGKAKGYCKLVRDRFNELNYDCQLFLLNAASMGVPQVRSRVFFLARRRDTGFPAIRLNFNEPAITFRDVEDAVPFEVEAKPERKGSGKRRYSLVRPDYDRPVPAITGSPIERYVHPKDNRELTWVEVSLACSFPYDYAFEGTEEAERVRGIAVGLPPVMAAQIAAQMAQQWFQVSKEQIDEPWKESQ